MSDEIITPIRSHSDDHHKRPHQEDCKDDHHHHNEFSWKNLVYFLVGALVLTALYYTAAAVQTKKALSNGPCNKTSGTFSFVFYLVTLLILWLFVVGLRSVDTRHF